MPHAALPCTRRIDALCGDFESAWNAGDPIPIEAMLLKADEGEQESLLAELIALEYELRVSAGEKASLSEYQERFPDEPLAVAAAVLRISAAEAFQAAPSPRERFESSLESGRLELGDRLGSGGMGVVFRAHDPLLGRDIAVKVLAEHLQTRRQAVARFLREARICARLEHPGIVAVHEMGWLNERPYFTMKLLGGQSLADLLAARRDAAKDAPHLLHVFERVCETLAYAHARNIVHRDLKPANVMLGEFGEVYVIDWGLAKDLAESDDETWPNQADSTSDGHAADDPPGTVAESGATGTLLGTVLGTPGYMSPEQATGHRATADRRSDVFSLGAILGEILTGASPTAIDFAARVDGSPADRELAILACACLARDPDQRPPDAGHVLRRVQAWSRGVQERLRKTELENARLGERRRRRRLILALTASLVLLLGMAAGGAGWMARRETARTEEESRQRQQVHGQLVETLDEIDQLQAEAPADWRDDLPRRTRIQALVRRAETLQESQPADTLPSRRVQALRYKLLAEDADGRLLDRLEQVRLERATVHGATGGYDARITGPMYREAFAEYGLDVKATSPQVAADKLKSRPKHVVEACIFGMESWRNLKSRKPAEAIWLDKVLDATDDDPWRREIRHSCRMKDWPSVRRLVSGISSEPPSVDAVVLVAMQLINASQFELAHQLLQSAQPRYPGDFWINQYLAITWNHIAKRRPDESIRYYTAALAIRESAATYQNLAATFKELKRYPEAEQAFRSAARLRPDWVHPQLDLAKLLAEQDRLEEALQYVDQAVASVPNLARAISIRGQFLIALGRREEGLGALRRAVELEGGVAAWHLALGIALRDAGELPEAVKYLRRASELDQSSVTARAMLRDTLTDLGQTSEAIAAGRAAVSLRGAPDDYRALAQLLESQGRHDEAEAIIQLAPHETEPRPAKESLSPSNRD